MFTVVVTCRMVRFLDLLLPMECSFKLQKDGKRWQTAQILLHPRRPKGQILVQVAKPLRRTLKIDKLKVPFNVFGDQSYFLMDSSLP